MGFVRGMMLIGCGYAVAVGVSAQVMAQRDWYRADETAAVPGFTRGVEGKPFVGKAVWTTNGRDPQFGDFYTIEASVDVMRDGEGRERLTWRVVDADPRVSTDGDLKTVLVLDPVARCVFLWMEDGTGKSLDAVKVRCEPDGVDVPARAAWNALTEYERGELKKEPENKPRYEDVAGETKDVGGVKATVYKHEEVREFDGGKRVQRTVDEERWYSDALGMVVATGSGEHGPFSGEDSTSFRMEGVKLGEPPAGAFGLPAGAAVEVDPRLRLVWESGARGQGEVLRAAHAASRGEWPSVRTAAMTDQAGRVLHPAFPESWFANGPTVAMPTFSLGPRGKPFYAMGRINVYPPEDKPTYGTQTIFFDLSVDGESRVRFKFRFLNGGDIEPVYVMDPVAGCIFQWSTLEPWIYAKRANVEKKAKVRCQAHGVVLPPRPRWDAPNPDEQAQIAKVGADKLHFIHEKVGKETFGGHQWTMGGARDAGDAVDAVKYAEYAVYAATEGKPEKKVLVGEKWFAEVIDEVVRATMMPPATGVAKAGKAGAKRDAPEPRVRFEMNAFELGEPVEEFYPPHGYAIEVDQTILPPFAPAPPKAAEKAMARQSGPQ
jgi:hypothetical protein